MIFLTAPKLDWGQSAGMRISVRRTISVEPQVIVTAGSNDQLQSRGLLSRLTDGSITSNEVIGEAIMTLLSAMTEVEASVQRHFTRNVVKIISVLSPGYATSPEPPYARTPTVCVHNGHNSSWGTIQRDHTCAEQDGHPNNYYPPRSELPSIWADISNAIQGFKDCSTTLLMLDEVLELELSNFARLLWSPGVDDDHLLVQQVANEVEPRG